MAGRVRVGEVEEPWRSAIAASLRAGGHELADDPAGAFDVLVTAGAAEIAAADAAGARLVFLSSVLVYGDGGEEEIDAAEPLIDPLPEHEALLEAEGAVFGSGVRFLVLRLGLPREAAGPAGPDWVPVLDPEDLGRWVATAVAHDLNGVYDAVSELVRGAAGASRRVTGAALRAVAG